MFQTSASVVCGVVGTDWLIKLGSQCEGASSTPVKMSCGPFVHSCVWQIGTVLELFGRSFILFYFLRKF